MIYLFELAAVLALVQAAIVLWPRRRKPKRTKSRLP